MFLLSNKIVAWVHLHSQIDIEKCVCLLQPKNLHIKKNAFDNVIWYAQNICSFTGSKPRKVLISPSILARNVQNARQYRLNNTFCSSLYISFPPGQTSITFHPARKNDHMVLHILSFMAKRWNLQLKSLFSSTFFLNQTHQSWWITLKYIFCYPYIDCKKIIYIYIGRRMNFPINKFIILGNKNALSIVFP